MNPSLAYYLVGRRFVEVNLQAFGKSEHSKLDEPNKKKFGGEKRRELGVLLRAYGNAQVRSKNIIHNFEVNIKVFDFLLSRPESLF